MQERPAPIVAHFDKLKGLAPKAYDALRLVPELVEGSKGWGRGATAEVTSGFVSTSSTLIPSPPSGRGGCTDWADIALSGRRVPAGFLLPQE